MLSEDQVLKLQKIAWIVVIAICIGIIAALLINKYSTPRILRNMPEGMHMCVSKDGSIVYSQQPCREGETRVTKPKKGDPVN